MKKCLLAGASMLYCSVANAGMESETLLVDEVSVSATRLVSSYAASPLAGATKTAIPLLETPMSVQTVSREVMDDQQVITIKDALVNVSGVMQNEYEYYDFVQIRGFDNGYAANYHNGLQLQAITGLETALLENIEVIKGPASMLYGRINPGGLVNLVSKKPQETFAASLQQQVGEYGLRRTVGDVTGKMTEDGRLLYRLIGAYTESESFMDVVQKRNQVGAAYFSFKPDPAFQFNLRLEAQENKFVDTEDIGIPIIGDRPADVSRSTFLGDSVGWDIPNQPRRTLLAFDWTYALNERWHLTQRFHWDDRDEQQFTMWLNSFDGVSLMERGIWYVQNDRKTLATNVDLTGDFSLGEMRHRVLFGVDWFRFTSNWNGFSGTTPLVPPIDIFQPDNHQVSASALKALDDNFFYSDRDQWTGLYAQDQISLSERWELMIGGRYDWAKTGNAETASQISLQEDTEFSPRAGLLYKYNQTTSIYTSYSESFGTNNGRTASGEALDPETARQYEIGFKHSALDQSLTASLSLFHLTKQNVLTPDQNTPDPDDRIAVGEIRNRGLEMDISGRVTPHVNLIATYTYNDMEITKDNDGNQGNRRRNVPRHMGSVWARYDTAPGASTGWLFGAGAVARGEREGDDANTWQLPGYAVVDVMAAYRTRLSGKAVSAQLNIKNLFDKEYFDRGGSSGNVAKYGQPVTAAATVSIDF